MSVQPSPGPLTKALLLAGACNPPLPKLWGQQAIQVSFCRRNNRLRKISPLARKWPGRNSDTDMQMLPKSCGHLCYSVGKSFMNFRIPDPFIHVFIKQVLLFSHNHGYHLLSICYRPGLTPSSCQVGFLSVSRTDLSHSHLHTFAAAILCTWNASPASSTTFWPQHAEYLGYGHCSLSLNSFSSIIT